MYLFFNLKTKKNSQMNSKFKQNIQKLNTQVNNKKL